MTIIRRWIVRDDDSQEGRSYVKAWHLDHHGDVDAAWTKNQREALRFGHGDLAALIGARAGGRPIRLVRNTSAFATVAAWVEAYNELSEEADILAHPLYARVDLMHSQSSALVTLLREMAAERHSADKEKG